MRSRFNFIFVFICTFFMCTFRSTLVLSQSNDKIYYDAFYEEYYNSFPNKNIKKMDSERRGSENLEKFKSDKRSIISNKKIKTNLYESDKPHRIPSDWESIYYNEAMRYWKYKTSDLRFDIGYQNISSQFEFEMNVGSILKWDRLNGTQIKTSFSKDFYIANKQYSGNFEYNFGKTESDYTLDDDLWNELHIFSAGRGDGKMSSMKASLGMRNYFRFFGWNITPGVGIQKKSANLKMFGHGQPVPFFLNCGGAVDVCELDNPFGNGNNYYIANGTLIPEGDIEVFSDVHLTNPEILPFNHDKFMSLFNGYSSVNKIDGVSHYYDVWWFGPFLSIDLEKIISIREGLLFRAELFYPKYNSRGVWPKRTEWKDFRDQGGISLGYSLSAVYTMKITPSVGIYGSLTTDYIMSKQMDTKINFSDGSTELYKKEIKRAEWKSTIIEIGLKYLF